MKFAEAFGFGRENPTGTSDLVLSSPDGESGRPVGKDEGLGNLKGKLVGRRSFGYFSSAVDCCLEQHARVAPEGWSTGMCAIHEK